LDWHGRSLTIEFRLVTFVTLWGGAPLIDTVVERATFRLAASVGGELASVALIRAATAAA
jgi:hypothetical protein